MQDTTAGTAAGKDQFLRHGFPRQKVAGDSRPIGDQLGLGETALAQRRGRDGRQARADGQQPPFLAAGGILWWSLASGRFGHKNMVKLQTVPDNRRSRNKSVTSRLAAARNSYDLSAALLAWYDRHRRAMPCVLFPARRPIPMPYG